MSRRLASSRSSFSAIPGAPESFEMIIGFKRFSFRNRRRHLEKYPMAEDLSLRYAGIHAKTFPSSIDIARSAGISGGRP